MIRSEANAAAIAPNASSSNPRTLGRLGYSVHAKAPSRRDLLKRSKSGDGMGLVGGGPAAAAVGRGAGGKANMVQLVRAQSKRNVLLGQSSCSGSNHSNNRSKRDLFKQAKKAYSCRDFAQPSSTSPKATTTALATAAQSSSSSSAQRSSSFSRRNLLSNNRQASCQAILLTRRDSCTSRTSISNESLFVCNEDDPASPRRAQSSRMLLTRSQSQRHEGFTNFGSSASEHYGSHHNHHHRLGLLARSTSCRIRRRDSANSTTTSSSINLNPNANNSDYLPSRSVLRSASKRRITGMMMNSQHRAMSTKSFHSSVSNDSDFAHDYSQYLHEENTRVPLVAVATTTTTTLSPCRSPTTRSRGGGVVSLPSAHQILALQESWQTLQQYHNKMQEQGQQQQQQDSNHHNKTGMHSRLGELILLQMPRVDPEAWHKLGIYSFASPRLTHLSTLIGQALEAVVSHAGPCVDDDDDDLNFDLSLDDDDEDEGCDDSRKAHRHSTEDWTVEWQTQFELAGLNPIVVAHAIPFALQHYCSNTSMNDVSPSITGTHPPNNEHDPSTLLSAQGLRAWESIVVPLVANWGNLSTSAQDVYIDPDL